MVGGEYMVQKEGLGAWGAEEGYLLIFVSHIAPENPVGNPETIFQIDVFQNDSELESKWLEFFSASWVAMAHAMTYN